MKMEMGDLLEIYLQQKGISNSTCMVECKRYSHLDKYPNIGSYSKNAYMSPAVNFLVVNFCPVW